MRSQLQRGRSFPNSHQFEMSCRVSHPRRENIQVNHLQVATEEGNLCEMAQNLNEIEREQQNSFPLLPSTADDRRNSEARANGTGFSIQEPSGHHCRNQIVSSDEPMSISRTLKTILSRLFDCSVEMSATTCCREMNCAQCFSDHFKFSIPSPQQFVLEEKKSPAFPRELCVKFYF
jgi:hypothetical protein